MALFVHLRQGCLGKILPWGHHVPSVHFMDHSFESCLLHSLECQHIFCQAKHHCSVNSFHRLLWWSYDVEWANASSSFVWVVVGFLPEALDEVDAASASLPIFRLSSYSGLCLCLRWWNKLVVLLSFMLPSTDKLYRDADFIFQQDLTPAHTAKRTKSWFWPWCDCAWLASKRAWPEPHRESMGYCQVEDERQQNQQCRWPEGRYQSNKATWASITPEQCHRLIASMPCCIDAVIHAKGGPTKYLVHRNEHTFQRPGISI